MTPKNDSKHLMTSADVARLLGVGPTAVKRWADAGTLPCLRTGGGHRRFRREDVDRFVAERSGGTSVVWDDWIDALLHDVDSFAVLSLLYGERARRGSWHDVAHHLGDLLTEVGARWAAGALTVLDEHVISASVQRALAAVVDATPVDPEAPRCLLAAVEPDEHTLGLSLVELCLREAGWRCEWAGARTPVDAVAERLSRGDLTMAALSASASIDDAGALGRVAHAAAEACRAHGVRLVLGGAGSWPEPPAEARRFVDLREFYRFAVDERRRLGDARRSR